MIERAVRSDDVQSILDLVETHYNRIEDDIGGMGESDPGVWFASVGNRDVLDYSLLLQQSIPEIKEHRHGIPFRLYSGGHPDEVIEWDAISQDDDSITLEISLFAATPKEYVNSTKGTEQDFSKVCGLIAEAAELMTVEVGVLKEYEAPAYSLAISLGAQQVHGYQKKDDFVNVSL